MCYSIIGIADRQAVVLPTSRTEGFFVSSSGFLQMKGGLLMVTYEALFTYTLVIIGIINLVYEIMKNKKK